MIKEKLQVTKIILEDYPQTRGDKGTGLFLNIASRLMFKDKPVDFTIFNAESWTRARRKILEMHPELDSRSNGTVEAEEIVRQEVA